MAALAYSMNDIEVIDYILDDFSKQLLKIDKDVLSTSDFGLFVSNSMDTIRVKEAITNLALTAMQNQTIDMSDVVKVMKKDSVTDAEEQLAVAEERKRDQNNALEKERMAHEQEMQKQAQEHLEKLWQHEADMIVLKEGERRKTEIQKQTILAMGFAENKDVNDNNVPDVLEVAREGLDAALKMRKQNLDENKFEHQKKVDEDKIKLEHKKLEKQNKAK